MSVLRRESQFRENKCRAVASRAHLSSRLSPQGLTSHTNTAPGHLRPHLLHQGTLLQRGSPRLMTSPRYRVLLLSPKSTTLTCRLNHQSPRAQPRIWPKDPLHHFPQCPQRRHRLSLLLQEKSTTGLIPHIKPLRLCPAQHRHGNRVLTLLQLALLAVRVQGTAHLCSLCDPNHLLQANNQMLPLLKPQPLH